MRDLDAGEDQILEVQKEGEMMNHSVVIEVVEEEAAELFLCRSGGGFA